MIDNIAGIPGVAGDNLYAEKPAQDLGLDNFLKMLLAQLKHQDPLNPVEGTEFSAMLAQFSSLEQLFSVNKNLESIMTDLAGGSRFQALDFIGKVIVAKGNILSLEEGKTATGGFTLDGNADCTVLITDPDGYPVRKISMGILAPGQHTFEWDGRDMKGLMREPGVFGFEITAMDHNDQFVPVETLITGQVTRVNLEGNSPVLYAGEIPVAISNVIDIKVSEDPVSDTSPLP